MTARLPTETRGESPAVEPSFEAEWTALDRERVDIWTAPLDHWSDAEQGRMAGLLATEETEQARGFHFERDRRRYIAGRAILRLLLGRYVGRPPGEIAFTYGPNGKPALEAAAGNNAGPATAVFFNLAHSEDLAVYAFTAVGEVGVDVEMIRDLPEWESIAETMFSAAELALLRAHAPEKQRREFFHAWARQEAVLKALGTGLGGEAAAAVGSDYDIVPLEIDPRFAAALAVRRVDGRKRGARSLQIRLRSFAGAWPARP